MASIAFRTTVASAVALVAATIKSVENVQSPAGHGLALTEFNVSFDGVTSSAVPALVQLTASTGTAGTFTATTPFQVRGRTVTGSAPTAGENASAEPGTPGSVYLATLVPVFNGVYTYQFPLGREIEMDSSAGAVKQMLMRITAPATVNARSYMEHEAIG